MRLSDNTVLFEFAGIPIIGSKSTGAIIGLTKDGLELCRRMMSQDVSEDVVRQVDSQLPEAFRRGSFLQGDSPEDRKVSKSAYVHVTQRCNLNCLGCYSDSGNRNALNDAPRERFALAFEKLARLGVNAIIISGGEPFLRRDLPELCADARERGVERITVITNGTCVDEGMLERMALIVDCVAVSFDGASSNAPAYIRGEQRFDQLVEAVAAIGKAGIQPHIIPTIHSRNYEDMSAYLQLAQELGATINFSLLSCFDPGKAERCGLVFDEETLKSLGQAIFDAGKCGPAAVNDLPVGSGLSLRLGCGAGVSCLSVDADGTVYPCHMLHYGKLALGNIFEDLVERIAGSPIAVELSALTVEAIDGCAACECSPFCGGGCRARAYAETGSLYAADPYCALTREFYRNVADELSAAYC